MLIRYGWLIANYHRGFTSNSRLVIWLLWTPWTPRNTSDKELTHRFASGYDFVMPEYYGSQRSDGDFTPQWCIDTLVDTYKFFTQWGSVQDIWTQEEVAFVGYQEVVVVGSSFGWAWVGRITQILPQITRVGLISPAIEYSNLGQIWYPEESYDEFKKILQDGWYGHMYRSATGWDRDTFYQDQRWQSYDEMIQELSTKNVFIAHGDEDDCVHVGRSRKLYKQLQTANPSWNHAYLEIPKWWHGWITKQIGVIEFCKWLHKDK